MHVGNRLREMNLDTHQELHDKVRYLPVDPCSRVGEVTRLFPRVAYQMLPRLGLCMKSESECDVRTDERIDDQIHYLFIKYLPNTVYGPPLDKVVTKSAD